MPELFGEGPQCKECSPQTKMSPFLSKPELQSNWSIPRYSMFHNRFRFPQFCQAISGPYFPRHIPSMPQFCFNKTCFQIQIGHSLVQSGQKNWSPAEPPGPQRLSSVWTESSALLLYRKTVYTCSP